MEGWVALLQEAMDSIKSKGSVKRRETSIREYPSLLATRGHTISETEMILLGSTLWFEGKKPYALPRKAPLR